MLLNNQVIRKMGRIKMTSDGEGCSLDGRVGLFFVVDGELMLHICDLSDGEANGDFINFPESHDAVWQREYYAKHQVDFDYFPRGRIIYNRATSVYKLFYDSCTDITADEIYFCYPEGRCEAHLDEYYRCHKCNKNYIV